MTRKLKRLQIDATGIPKDISLIDIINETMEDLNINIDDVVSITEHYIESYYTHTIWYKDNE